MATEHEYPLDGRAAYNAMMDGKVIERWNDIWNCTSTMRWDGRFMLLKTNGEWTTNKNWVAWHDEDQNAKWRIVEESE